jgi:cytochrome b6-f complex iron-sulfur subunit
MTRLPVNLLSSAVRPAADDVPPCACSRRAVLKGLGCLAVAALPFASAGCASSGSQLGSASTQMCGTSLCLDLSQAANAALTKPGGALIVDAPGGDTLVIIRSNAASVAALSAVCTHRGCIVDFDPSRQIIACPCHGSEFAQDGSVIHGPANRPLTKYSATLSGNQIMVTLG